ncbi:unnamed protein product [Prorocentrum cordatum]|uniref:Ribosome biogenesis protein NOP53 n=1 Tax=Prorocentrum cordatum TaxID=2364126 RepID=A0ABN9PBG9_9DINO|nr:unnamed protein product [Polarella glacialis]
MVAAQKDEALAEQDVVVMSLAATVAGILEVWDSGDDEEGEVDAEELLTNTDPDPLKLLQAGDPEEAAKPPAASEPQVPDCSPSASAEIKFLAMAPFIPPSDHDWRALNKQRAAAAAGKRGEPKAKAKGETQRRGKGGKTSTKGKKKTKAILHKRPAAVDRASAASTSATELKAHRMRERSKARHHARAAQLAAGTPEADTKAAASAAGTARTAEIEKARAEALEAASTRAGAVRRRGSRKLRGTQHVALDRSCFFRRGMPGQFYFSPIQRCTLT